MSRGRTSPRLDGPVARRLHATVTGKGPEMVVFMHGLGTDQTVWDGVLRTLPANFSALRYDLPGVSPSSPDAFDAQACRSLAPFADDLISLLEELGLDQCSVVGHSAAGLVAMLASIEAPERFRRLVTINTSPRYIDEPGYVGGFTPTALASQFQAMAEDYQAWVAGFAQVVVPADAPEALASFTGSLSAMRPDVAIAVARLIFAVDQRPLLGAVTVAVDLIHSRSDPAVPAAVGHYLHAHLAGSRLQWIDAAGHLPHLSAPDELADLIWPSLA